MSEQQTSVSPSYTKLSPRVTRHSTCSCFQRIKCSAVAASSAIVHHERLVEFSDANRRMNASLIPGREVTDKEGTCSD